MNLTLSQVPKEYDECDEFSLFSFLLLSYFNNKIFLLLQYHALILCLPYRWRCSYYYIFHHMEMLDHAISRVWLHFNPTTLCREGEKTIWILQLFLAFLPKAGIKPGPPAQQASALSITPLPLGISAIRFITSTASFFQNCLYKITSGWKMFHVIDGIRTPDLSVWKQPLCHYRYTVIHYFKHII